MYITTPGEQPTYVGNKTITGTLTVQGASITIGETQVNSQNTQFSSGTGAFLSHGVRVPGSGDESAYVIAGYLPGWTAIARLMVSGGPRLALPQAIPGSANYGALSIGSGPFDGASAGFFTGSSSGTGLAINAASGFGGSLVNLQVAGVRRFVVDGTGTTATYGTGGVGFPAYNWFLNGSLLGNLDMASAGAFQFHSGAASAQFRVEIDGSSNTTLSPIVNKSSLFLAGVNATAVTAEQPFLTATAPTITITGNYATQRFTQFAQPTISAGSALTITNAATVAIAGAPTAAGSAVITNPYALWVQGGTVRFDNAVALGAGAPAVPGTIGGSGPATAAQNEWIRLDTQNGPRWVPAWA